MPLWALTFEAGSLAATLQDCANIYVEGGAFSYANFAEKPKGLLFGVLMNIYFFKSSESCKGLIRKA